MSDNTKIEWCDDCQARIVRVGRLELIWSAICWRFIMVWPVKWMTSWPALQMLPYAGTHAYCCRCWHKVRNAAPWPPKRAGRLLDGVEHNGAPE